MNEMIYNAEKLMQEENYPEASKLLKKILQEDPDNGRAAADAGVICIYLHEIEASIFYLQKALDNGYDRYTTYLNLAGVKKQTGQQEEAEKLYREALKRADTKERKWTCQTMLGKFYLENEKFLRAEKVAKTMIKEYPDNYQGHRLQTRILIEQKQYQECENYMKKLEQKFGRYPVYLQDRKTYLYQQGKKKEVLELIENNPVYMELIPQETLRTKMACLTESKQYDEARAVIKQLINEFEDIYALTAEMILSLTEGRLKKTIKIAEYILEKEEGHSERRSYFQAAYYLLMATYLDTNQNPDKEMLTWMIPVIQYCKKWLQMYEVNNQEMNEALADMEKTLNQKENGEKQ